MSDFLKGTEITIPDFLNDSNNVTLANSSCSDACMNTCMCMDIEAECNQCENACQLVNEACLATCLSVCQCERQGCQTCQTVCQTACQTGCELNCQENCQMLCQFTCEKACLTTCQSYCQDMCQIACQCNIQQDQKPRPANFTWQEKKIGEQTHITINDVISLRQKINEFRIYKYLTAFSFVGIDSTCIWHINYYNEFIDAMIPLTQFIRGTLPTKKSTSEIVKRTDMTFLIKLLNSIR